jgi:uncharacterized damage-inducible protein DinB
MRPNPNPTDPHPSDPHTVLLETYAINDAMNQLLLAHLDPRAWCATLPGPNNNDEAHKKKTRSGRTIAAIFAHMHNVRLKWLKGTAPHLKRPAPLDPYRCTQKQAAAALKQSAAQCLHMLTDALSADPSRRVTKFFRDPLMPIWPANANMFAYMFAHEAHHRGQITMLAHQLGYRLPPAAWGGIWNWNRLWKQAGHTTRPQ